MALTIKRKLGETLHVGAAVVTVRKIERGAVTLNVQAPRDVEVDRGEVHEAKQRGKPCEAK